jgi:hypothetical protein
MVSCGAQGCSWERATDNRGLNRHRGSCHFFKKSGILATQKRLQRARNATLANLVSSQSQSESVTVGSTQVSDVSLQSPNWTTSI